MYAVTRIILNAFFGEEGIREYEDLKRNKVKTGFSFSALFGAEWLAVAAAQSLVTYLVTCNPLWTWTEFRIWLLLWAADMLFAGLIILTSNNTDSDPTLMVHSRRFVDLAFKKSLISGIIIELAFFAYNLIWAETSSFYIFFRKRMGSFPLRILGFVIVACIKMRIWARIYIFNVGIFVAIRSLITG